MIVHLTGGIGCGKSSVATMLRELGARTVDADEIVHALYERDDVQRSVGELVGLEPPLSRSDIARRVFGDDSLLRQLETLIHPLVHARMQELRALTPRQDILVYEVPLPPRPEPGDVVICVEADEGVRVQRLRERGMQDGDIFARIAAAPGAHAYREHATHVIDNSGDLGSLRTQVLEVWEGIRDGARTV